MGVSEATAPYQHPLDPTWRLVADVRPADLLNWAKQYKSGNTAPWNNELETYLPQNVYIDSATGDLILEGRNTGGGNPSVGGGVYTSGMAASYNALSFKYGYLESRIKMPAGKGVWPAFWTLLTTYASSDELDIVEIFEQATVLHRGLHYENPPGTKLSDGGQTTVADMSADYHVYALQWTPTAITWYFDGAQIFQVTNAVEFPHDVMYVLLNVAIGGVAVTPPDSTTPFPLRMHVQYVRLWQRATAEYVLQATPQQPAYGSYKAAVLADAPVAYYPCTEMSGGLAKDLSGNGNDATITGGVTLGVAGILADGSPAMQLNGTTGYLAVPASVSPTGKSAYSLEGWFRLPSALTHDSRFIANGHTDVDHTGLELSLSSGNTGGLSAVGNAGGNIQSFWTKALTVGANYHIVFVYDGKNLYTYINNVLIKQSSNTGGAIASAAYPINIGRGPWNNDYLAGVIGHVALYDHALSAASIGAHYVAGTTSPARGETVTLADAPTGTVTMTDAPVASVTLGDSPVF